MSGYMIEVTQEALDRANEEIVRLRAALEAAERQIGHKADEYKRGFIDGITAYAWYKDGVQQVGTTGRTRREAIDKVEKTWNYSPLDTGTQAQIEAQE